MITAIVLVHVEADRIPEVAEAIAALDGVSEVYSVTGGADLIAMVRVREHEALADVIADRLSKVAGRPRDRDPHRLPDVLPARPRRGLLPRRRGPRLAAPHHSSGESGLRRRSAPTSTTRRCERRRGLRRAQRGTSLSRSPATGWSRPTGQRAARTAVDRLGGPAHGGGELPGQRAVARRHGHQRGGRVEQHRVAHRPALAGEEPPGSPRRCAPRRRRAARRARPARDRRPPGSPGPRSPRRRAPPTPATSAHGVSSSRPSVTAEDQRADAPVGQHLGHDPGHPRVGDADRLGGGLGRVGQRAEEVEDRRDAELATGHGRVPQRRVEPRREAERDARLVDARRRPGRGPRSMTTPSSSSRSAEPHAEDAARLPCLTTRAPVPATTIADMVEMLTVCARSPPVPQVSTAGPATSIRSARPSMAADQAGDLVGRLALGPQRDHEPGDLRRGRLAEHHLLHRPGGVGRGQVLAAQQPA